MLKLDERREKKIMILDYDGIRSFQTSLDLCEREFEMFFEESQELVQFCENHLCTPELTQAIIEGLILRTYAKFEFNMTILCEHITSSISSGIKFRDYKHNGVEGALRFIDGLIPLNFRKTQNQLCNNLQQWNNLRNIIAHKDSTTEEATITISSSTGVKFDYELQNMFLFTVKDFRKCVTDLQLFSNELFKELNIFLYRE
ncbi:hypothetical protein ABEV00_27630 [Paenibacillus thiaminolyticus]|uniref:hypothetical protein n=1 Tax=Paenibacillus thiaminolyticus TaxID=49283 RepID=UPI003D2E4304